MRIMVTGAAGFVGRATVPALEELGHEVIPYDIIATRHEDMSWANPDFDIRNVAKLKEMLEPGDKILHLAAVARFGDCELNPALAYSTNVGGTAAVLQAAQEVGVERVVHASTGSCYMPVLATPIIESHRILGNSHYGVSKVMAERLFKDFSAPFIILRYSHLYGAKKFAHGAIGGFLDRFKRGLNPVIFGGKQSNDVCFIKDIVQANIKALFTDHTNQVFNIGTGVEITTQEMFEIMADVFGYDGLFEHEPQREVDAPRMVFDISKAREMLGYRPQYTLRQGLEDMVNEQI